MSRWQALAVLSASTLMIVIDQTIVSVALPSIRADLGFSATGLAWVVNAYVIPFGGLLLLAGRFGDLVGRKRMFVAGRRCSRPRHCCAGSRRTRDSLSRHGSCRASAAPWSPP